MNPVYPCIALLLLFSSCAPSMPASDEKSCTQQGGKWGPIGLMPEAVCNLPTTDGGKECTDAKDCQGSCIAELEDQNVPPEGIVTNGQCTPWKVTVGCHAFVNEGRVQGILCVD